MIHVVSRSRLYFIISAVLLVIGLAGLVAFRLPLSIEFTGGSLTTFHFGTEVPAPEVFHSAMATTPFNEAQAQTVGTDALQVRQHDLTNEEHQAFTQAVIAAFPSAREESFESIGPSLGKELQVKAGIAVLVVLLGIILYLTYVFRGVSRPVPSWVYGAMAIVALLHDLGFTIGFYAWLSHWTGATADSLFVTALLTVLGFSVHDTIVVFDRIRENLTRFAGAASFADIVTTSVNQTFARSLNTSLTTILVLVCLAIFGGQSIFPFAMTLAVGITAGTYSSIFIASPLLVWYLKRTQRAK